MPPTDGSGPQGPVPQRSLTSLRAPTNPDSPRGELAKTIPRRPRVTWWLGLVFAFGFALLATTTITAERWLGALGAGQVITGKPASMTVRVPAMAGFSTAIGRIGNGGIVIERGQVATEEDALRVAAIADVTPRGPLPYLAFFLLTFVLAAICTHHMRRSTRGRLVRVQVVSLVAIFLLALAVKIMLLTTSLSMLVVPVAVLAIMPTLALDRIVGLATGILGALIVALLGPFDVGVAILLLVQAAVAGLVVAEHPKDRWRAVITAGCVTTLFTAATYVLLTYLTTGHSPVFRDPLHAAWFAAALGPAIATVLAVPLIPVYQLLVGEITRGKLIELEDLSNPLLRQIAEKAPGTWQHSLMMANLAEIAANAIGASGRLVRVGAYYHDLGKSLQPKYFIENLEPGETSPHDQLPPEVSCDAIFAHVTEGIVAARRAGLHERIVDFMHMHHGNGVLEYFWGKTREQGNPHGLSVEQFRYPGHPPQSRETAILAICDAVEAASRTLKKPDAASIDSLVQRIVYGKLHLGQLDESGLSMADLRRISDSLRETIRHANHGRIEYPWQKAQHDASAIKEASGPTTTSPRLDSLDREPAKRETVVKQTPPADSGRISGKISGQDTNEVALAATADIKGGKNDKEESADELAILATAPALSTEPPIELHKKVAKLDDGPDLTTQPRTKRASKPDDAIELVTQPNRQRTSEREEAIDLITEPREKRASDRDEAVEPITEPPTKRESAPGRPSTQPPPFELRPPSQPHLPEFDRVLRPPTEPPEPPSDVEPTAPTAARTVNDRSLRPPTQPPPSELRRPSEPRLARARPPSAAPSGMITPALFAEPPRREARKRAATLPPISQHQRPPTVMPGRRSPTIPPMSRTAGPPSPVDLDDAVTHPPPLRRTAPEVVEDDGPKSVPTDDVTYAGQRTPRFAAIEERVTNERPAASLPPDDASVTSPAMPKVEDSSRTEPSMPRFQLPLKAPPSDEWSSETPVRAPTASELRALTGSPDPTKQQSLAELERLHRVANEDGHELDFLHRRRPMPTTEVDPDDIESAIEVAPPARRPNANAIAVAKPKKSE